VVSLVGGIKGEASLLGGVKVRHHLLVVCKGEASLVGGATCWWCHLLVLSKVRRHLLVVCKGEASLVGGVQGRGVACWWCTNLQVRSSIHPPQVFANALK